MFMFFPRNSLLARALIASLLLHAALLGMKRDSLPDSGVPDVPPLVAFLVTEPAEKAQPPASAGIAATAAEPVKRARSEAVPRSKNAVRKITVPDRPSPERPAAHPVPVSESAGLPPDRGTPSVAQDVSPATAENPVSGAGGSQSAGGALAPGGGVSSRPEGDTHAEDIQKYRTMLAMWLSRRVESPGYYPALARARNWEGTTRVVLDFRCLQPEPAAHIGDSSKRNILDEQALEMVRQAVLAVGVPERLKKQDFRISLSVRFDLTD